jgi:hypothetical protein
MPLAIGAPNSPVMAASFLDGGFFIFNALLGEAIEAFLGGIFGGFAKETRCFDSSVSDSISLL